MKLNTAIFLLGTLTATAASAGASVLYPDCVNRTDGSGYCGGSFEAFRKSSGSSDYATFISFDGGYRYFIASLNGQYYTCSAASNTVTYAQWPSAMANSGGFLIQWNSAGTCTWLSLYNGSQYQSGW